MLTFIVLASAVVFGKVVEGMAVVKRIEAAGSKSGRTAQRVVVVDCGELASRRKIMAQLEAEKARASANQLHSFSQFVAWRAVARVKRSEQR